MYAAWRRPDETLAALQATDQGCRCGAAGPDRPIGVTTVRRVSRWVKCRHALEALVEAVVRSESRCGINAEATREVAEQAQDLWECPVALRQSTPPVEDPCGAPEVAREHRGQAAQREVGARIRLLEPCARLRQPVDIGGELPSVAVGAEVIGS